ncbi:phosphorylase [Photobacterium nomapromontoriensis]
MPIATKALQITEGGVTYFVHIATANAGKKLAATTVQANPFKPYEAMLYVGDAGAQHVCLLNKFPVLSPHLLICSKDFISQSTLLANSDFEAWLLGFDRDDVLGFYNSGPIAGASQAHRHMQLVRTSIPLNDVICHRQLPFESFLYEFESLQADRLYQGYMDALQQLELIKNDGIHCYPHNILLTAKWMLIVPRSTNNVEGIFANGLNYSGRFLVKRKEQLAWLQQFGLMKYLTVCSR